MEYDIVKKGGYDYLKFLLDSGEEIFAQPGALMMLRGDVEVNTKMLGGKSFIGLKVGFLAQESVFINRFVAKNSCELWFSPSLPGVLESIDLKGEEFYLKDGAYLCHYGDIVIDTKFFGLKGIFSNSGLFWLKVSGNGRVFTNTFGGIEEINLEGNEILVDNYNLLAFSSGVNAEIVKLGGMKTFFFGGEGLMFKLSGYGKVLIQTRNLPSFAYQVMRFSKE